MSKNTPYKTSVTVIASLDNLAAIQDFVRDQADKTPMPESIRMRLELIVEELALNIINHSYRNQPVGNLTFSCSVDSSGSREKKFVMEIRDEGSPFDPLAYPDADIHKNIESSNPGGLGILLTKQMSDGLAYHHDKTSNILTVTIKLPTDS